LCHKDARLKRNLGPEDVRTFLVASAAQPGNQTADLSQGKRETFRTPDGASVETNRPLTKASLIVLRENWPRSLGLEALLKEAYMRLGVSSFDPVQGGSLLAADLLQCLQCPRR